VGKTRKLIYMERQQRILRKALTLVSSQGYLSFKVTDAAKAAKVSIGTFYSHFDSKGDLIVALAGMAWRGRLDLFNAVFAKEELEASERILVAVFCDFLFSVDHPILFVAEQLAITSEVWHAASNRHTHVIQLTHEKIISSVANGARQAINSGGFKTWEDPAAQAQSMDQGLWTLMLGASYITHAESTMSEGELKPVIPQFLINNCMALYTGYGWLSSNPRDDIHRIAKYCQDYGHYEQLFSSKTGDPEWDKFMRLARKGVSHMNSEHKKFSHY